MSNLRETLRVPWEDLNWTKSLSGLVGSSTAEVKPQDEIIGQDRAVKAIKLGLSMKSTGYNVFVAGPQGTGRRTTVEKLISELNVDGPIPGDLCYVNNFKHPDQPRLLRFDAGKGRDFKKRMSDLIETLEKKVPAVFESEEFQAARNDIINQHIGRQKALFKNFETKVSKESFMMVQVQVGPYMKPDLAPVIVGNAMKIEQLESLVEEGKFSGEELEKIKGKYKDLSQEMEKLFKEAREIDRTISENLDNLARDWVEPLLGDLLNPILEEFRSDALDVYLTEIKEDIVQHLDRFRPKLIAPQSGEAGPPMVAPPGPTRFNDHEVNLVVDNSETAKAPVVFETAPTYRNLFGTVERVMEGQGMWASDYRHIKAGSLLRANGGYLIINAMDLLTEPGVWPVLKRTLRNQVLEIQTDPFSLFILSALKPEKIPIKLKIIMIGDQEIYDLLLWYDEDFQQIFKVKADFDYSMPNTDENISKLVGYMAKLCADEGLLPFDASGVESVTRHGIRMAGRKKKITTQFEKISDLIREADLAARQAGVSAVSDCFVEQAYNDRMERVNMMEDKIHEYIEDGILLIDTEGYRVGQINGLSVYTMPEFSFGRPSRITAKVSLGKSGIINIEREAELSGNSYNKGVLILSGFLRDRFAQDKPLNLTASITFEQSYSGVDGDSASSTEIYALLSSLSGKPIDQGVAVTGSVNQHGEIQPIGGVNEKIEGFFRVCKAKGLNGKQGVMIPKTNIGDLLLRPDVVEAVKDGRFHIWAVEHVDQGIELLTGAPAGEPDQDGNYPEGTINYLTDLRLEDIALAMKEFEAGPEEPPEEEPRSAEPPGCGKHQAPLGGRRRKRPRRGAVTG